MAQQPQVVRQAPPKTIERQGDSPVPYVHRFPDVISGICEYCGVLDKNLPSQYQYKLCEHYRDVGTLRCTYCTAEKDPDQIVYHSKMTVYEHPQNPGVLVVCCNSYTCTEKHEKRFGAR